LVLTLLIVLTNSAISFLAGSAQSSSAACRDWHECRELALQAADRREYEIFHDLAWRTVQTGPPRDPDLMYLLARAQCLSGRPHDALVMLRRLAEMGVANDAAVNPDFERTRALPGWPDVAALIERIPSAGRTDSTTASRAAAGGSGRAGTRPPAQIPAAPRGSSPAVSSSATGSSPPATSTGAARSAPPGSPVTPPAVSSTVSPPTAETASPATNAPAAASPAAGGTAINSRGAAASPVPTSRSRAGLPAFKPLRVEEAVRVSPPRFAAAGLAYDAVSRRFVVGDLRGSRLIVVSEGSDHAVDLVRADSAGFHEIRALEIDWRRGDLWVVSATPELEWSVHRLQLLSGRLLKAIAADKRLQPMTLVDVAVTPSGTVLILDATKSRLLVVRPRAQALEVGAQMRIENASSVTTDEEGIAYVAHAHGIVRVDPRTGTTAAVTPPGGFDLAGIDRVRWHGFGLVATQALPDGSRRIVQLELNAARRAITSATVIDDSLPAGSRPPFVTVSGDELSYLVAGNDTPSQSTSDSSNAPAEFIVRRIHLQ
jgi:hypothetical protein